MKLDSMCTYCNLGNYLLLGQAWKIVLPAGNCNEVFTGRNNMWCLRVSHKQELKTRYHSHLYMACTRDVCACFQDCQHVVAHVLDCSDSNLCNNYSLSRLTSRQRQHSIISWVVHPQGMGLYSHLLSCSNWTCRTRSVVYNDETSDHTRPQDCRER